MGLITRSSISTTMTHPRQAAFVSSTACRVYPLIGWSASVSRQSLSSRPRPNIGFAAKIPKHERGHHKKWNACAELIAEKTGTGSETTFISGTTGVDFEVIHAYPLDEAARVSTDVKKELPPLVFIHGSKHAAWCYYLFQSYFARLGYHSYSVSLRGTGCSIVHSSTSGNNKFTIDDCVSDLNGLWPKLNFSKPPVIVAHSIGGFIAQKFLAAALESATESPLASASESVSTSASELDGNSVASGLVLIDSSPPSGNNKMVWRILFSLGLKSSWDITRAFVTNALATDVELCKKVLFSPKDDNDLIKNEYMPKFYVTPQTPRLDTRSLAPIKTPPLQAPRTLVLRGNLDTVVDQEAAEETARFWKGEYVAIDDGPHDLMLYHNWKKAAKAIADWINKGESNLAV